jgi:hypothetical protein
MVTVAEVKKLVKPLVERHPDLALVGRLIFIKPIRHYLRAVLIDRTSDRCRFKPRWFIDHLFKPRAHYHITWGEEIYRRAPGGWQLSNSETQPKLLERIEQDVLPKLRAIDTLEKYVAAVSDNYFRHLLFDKPQNKVIVDIALGDLGAAQTICTGPIANHPSNAKFLDEEDRQQFLQVKNLCRLLAIGDRKGLARILHDWEIVAVKNIKLEHVWEPTPFPLELLPN